MESQRATSLCMQRQKHVAMAQKWGAEGATGGKNRADGLRHKRRASRRRCLVWICVSPSSPSARHREVGGWNNNSGVM